MKDSPDCARVREDLEKKFHISTLSVVRNYHFQGVLRGHGFLLLWRKFEYFTGGLNWYKMTDKKAELITGKLAEEFNQWVIYKLTKSRQTILALEGWMPE